VELSAQFRNIPATVVAAKTSGPFFLSLKGRRMRFSLSIAVVAVALCCGMFAGQTQAQSVYAKHLRDGYGFGVGNSYGFRVGQGGGFTIPGGSIFGGGFIVSNPREDVPYFAKFPPVYYNGIIARPYGISPYAAPPGIMPVEMMPMPAAEPIVITNPHVVPGNNQIPQINVPSGNTVPVPAGSDQLPADKPLIEPGPATAPAGGAMLGTPSRSTVVVRRQNQRIVNPHRVHVSQSSASSSK
jgi:hypothetical protein